MQSPSLKNRLLALLIDSLVLLSYALLLFSVTLLICFTLLDGVPTLSELQMNLISLTLIIPVFLCSVIMESGKKHATLGKRKMNLTVSSANCRSVRTGQILLRNIIKFLPWQLAHMVVFHVMALNGDLPPLWMAALLLINILPLIWIAFLFRKDHRGVHDLLAKTRVADAADTADQDFPPQGGPAV